MASETKAASSRSKRSTETSPAKTARTAKISKAGVATGQTAVKTAAKTPTAKTRAKPAAAPAAAKSAPKRKPKATGKTITADARLRHIEVAAYYIAEASGFSRNPAECWIAAERQIDGLLLGGQI